MTVGNLQHILYAATYLMTYQRMQEVYDFIRIAIHKWPLCPIFTIGVIVKYMTDLYQVLQSCTLSEQSCSYAYASKYTCSINDYDRT